MNISKIFGWVLIICGILIIAWTLYYSYGIFTNQNKVPEIFKLEFQKENASFQSSQAGESEKPQNQMKKIIQEQLSKMISKKAIYKSLNLASWGILAWIFIFGGFQISSLGIKLMKK